MNLATCNTINVDTRRVSCVWKPRWKCNCSVRTSLYVSLSCSTWCSASSSPSRRSIASCLLLFYSSSCSQLSAFNCLRCVAG